MMRKDINMLSSSNGNDDNEVVLPNASRKSYEKKRFECVDDDHDVSMETSMIAHIDCLHKSTRINNDDFGKIGRDLTFLIEKAETIQHNQGVLRADRRSSVNET